MRRTGHAKSGANVLAHSILDCAWGEQDGHQILHKNACHERPGQGGIHAAAGDYAGAQQLGLAGAPAIGPKKGKPLRLLAGGSLLASISFGYGSDKCAKMPHG